MLEQSSLVQLLCQFESNSVLKFLQTFDNYRLEHCLLLCQEYGVTDAAAFLLERVGDVGNALVLVMAGLEDKLNLLIDAVEKNIGTISGNTDRVNQPSAMLKMNEVGYLNLNCFS